MIVLFVLATLCVAFYIEFFYESITNSVAEMWRNIESLYGWILIFFMPGKYGIPVDMNRGHNREDDTTALGPADSIGSKMPIPPPAKSIDNNPSNGVGSGATASETSRQPSKNVTATKTPVLTDKGESSAVMSHDPEKGVVIVENQPRKRTGWGLPSFWRTSAP